MNVKEKFQELQKTGIIKSVAGASKAMGISSSRLSQYLNNIYSGDNRETEEIVKNYVQLVEEREKTSTTKTEFILTQNAKRTLDTARLTHVQKTIGIITGRAGLGKSMALKKYSSEHPDVIYIEVDTAFSARELLAELHRQIGLNGKGMLNPMKNDIISKLKGLGRLLIIDQAEYLPVKALDLLRTIHDKADIGILLAGLPILLHNIKGVGSVHEQLYTRVGVNVELRELTDDDIQQLVDSSLPEMEDVYKDFIEPSRRNARVLRMLVRESKRIAQNRKIPVNKEIIKSAYNQLIH